MMKNSDLMTQKPAIIAENASILEAINKMQSIGCGMLPIGSDIHHIKGVITDRDIMMRAVAKNKDLKSVPVADIMSKNVIFCEEDGFLQQAVYLMNTHNTRRILVRDKSQALTGVISMGDIVRRIHDKSLLATLFSETSVA